MPELDELIEAVSREMRLGGAAQLIQAMRGLQSVADIIPPWWSPSRDRALDALVTANDHLGGIIYSTSTKLVNIPLKFVPKNPSVSSHADLAVRFTEQIKEMSGYGQGFREEYKLGLYDLLGQDNGMFLGIMGEGITDWDRPLSGMPLGIRHLDSQYVTRTGNPLYPIVYADPEFSGNWAYHYSRVIMLSQMPSARKNRFRVGRCALGRSVRIGQILQDQLVYKMERMGTRPTSEILAVEGGEAADIIKTMLMSKEMMDSLGLERFSKALAMGLPIGGKLHHVRLNEFDMFDEQIGTTMAIFALAYIWGLDPRDIWPLQGSSQGNEITNMVARGKLPAEFTTDMKFQLDLKFCPKVLEAVYDFQDDEEDQARAVSQDIRARRRERNAKSGLIDVEAERRMMILDGDLSRDEFIRMQLIDGKLEDGTSLATLFYSEDELLSSLLSIPDITNPLLYSQNDTKVVLEAIEVQKTACYQVLASGGRTNTRKGSQALAALEWLESQYDKPEPQPVAVRPSTIQDVEEALTNDEEE